MAQELADILKELDAGYSPQRDLINKQLTDLPAQADAQVAGLQGQATQAYDDITAGARSRGIGFSGIPLAEQAKYNSGTFLPAVANVKKAQTDQQTSLLGALSDSNISERGQANTIRQAQLDREQAASDAAAAREQAAAEAEATARRAAAASAGPDFSSLLSGFGTDAPAAPAASKVDPLHQQAYNEVKALLATNNGTRIQNVYNAYAKSAKNGNAKDQAALELMHQLYPASVNFGKTTVPLTLPKPNLISLTPAPAATNGLRVTSAPALRLN